MKRARAARSEPAPLAAPAGEGAVSRGLLLLAPCLSGAAIMGLELVGLRLLAPRFGASTYVWGGLLGTIMAALAVGYLLGGALADRRPRPGWVFALLLASAAWVAGDLLVTEAVLDAAEGLGASLGPVLATALLLAPPMLLLGSVSPFVIRLEGQLSSLGVTAGRVFALSTAGSLAGTFVTAFWWIPAYGCRQTLRVLVTALVLVGIAGLAWPRSRAGRAALALALAAVPFLAPDPPLRPGIVFAGESPYNTVYVEDQGGNRLLRLNDPRRGFHSVAARRGHAHRRLLRRALPRAAARPGPEHPRPGHGRGDDGPGLSPLLSRGPGDRGRDRPRDRAGRRRVHGPRARTRPRRARRGRAAVPEGGERGLRRDRGRPLRRGAVRAVLLPHRGVLPGGPGAARAPASSP